MQFNVTELMLLLIMVSKVRAQIDSDNGIDGSVTFQQGLEHLKDLLGVLNTGNGDGEVDVSNPERDEIPQTPAQDRQLIVPLVEEEFDVFFLERKYSHLMESLRA